MSDLIKREDVIEAIDKMICDNKWVCECAINSLPSAQPQGELISKADAIRALERSSVYAWSVEQDKSAHNWAISIIESLPSAQPQGELISKDDAIKAVANYIWHLPNECYKNFNSYNDIEEVVTDAVKQLPSTNDNWIPVSERLPKVTDTVLVQDVCGDIETVQVCTRYDGSLIFDGEWEYELEEVVVWQPLPTPYKGGGAE